jgi:T5SS/PEP-CTERM-associated repeat protein
MRSAFRDAALCAAVLLALSIACANAASFYADSVLGNDGFDGLSPQYGAGHGPKRTVSAAIATVDNNGTISVAQGLYGEALWDLGTKTLTLRPAGTVTIYGTTDTDNDGIPDYWESTHGLNPNDPSDAGQASSDPEAHGLTNLQVYQNPSVLVVDGYSTLGDGVGDWWKVKYGFSLTDPTVADARLDCWTNRQKYENGVAASAPDPPFSLPYTADYQTNITCETIDYWSGVLVGDATHSDVLVVQNGGVLNDYAGYIGYEGSSSNNTVIITDSGSAWTNYYEGNDWFGDLVIGWAGAGNNLMISNGAYIYTEGMGIVGYEESSSNNAVLVTGSDSGWDNYWGPTVIGWTGAVNRLVIRDGAFVYNWGSGVIGYDVSSRGNTVLVTDSGSGWYNDYWLVVGGSGAGNSLVISNGAYADTWVIDAEGYAIIGYDPSSSNNAVVVTDSGSTWINYYSGLVIGWAAARNSLVIRNGAYVYDQGGVIGGDGSNNTVLVTDSHSTWWNDGPLYVGGSGAGNSLVISKGGFVYDQGFGDIGDDVSSSNNAVVVTDPDSVWTNEGPLYVGASGAGNTLVISNGGQMIVSSGGQAFDSQVYVGLNSSSSNNLVLVTDPGSLWTNESFLWVGWKGTANGLVISNSGHVVSLYGSIGVWYSSSNSGVLVTGSGSVWSNLPRLCVGYGGVNNSLFIENGGEVVSHNLILGYWEGSVGNLVGIDNGILTVTNESGDAIADVRGGALTINGGTCAVDTLLLTNGLNSALVFNGGTLTASTLTMDNGAIVECAVGTNSRPITVSGDLTLNGTLNIHDAGGLAAGTYTLFTYGGALSGGLAIGTSACFASIDSSTPGQFKLNVQSVPRITSPDPNSTVSGVIPVEVDLDNAASITWVTLMVDGNDYVTKTSPPFTFYLATHIFTNGVHSISAKLASEPADPVSSDVAEYVVETGVTALDFENTITMTWFPSFQTQLPLLARIAYDEADWSVEIANADGTVLRTLSGSTSSGEINAMWDGRDDLGNPVPDSTQYFLTFAAAPRYGQYTSSSSSSALPPVATFREAPWGTQQTLLARIYFGYFEDIYWGIAGFVEGAARDRLANIEWYIGQADRNQDVFLGAPLILEPAPSDYQARTSWSEFLNYLADGYVAGPPTSRPRNITQLYYYGHGAGNRLACCLLAPEEHTLVAPEIEAALGNWVQNCSLGLCPLFNTPYKFVWLDGCTTANGNLPQVFAILKDRRNYGTTVGAKNRAFMGWSIPIFKDWLLNPRHTLFAQGVFQRWTEDTDRPLAIAIAMAQQDAGYLPSYHFLKVYGYDQLTWGE